MTLPLCGVPCPAAGLPLPYRCTRPLGHPGDHIAGIGPWHVGEHILARWRPGAAPHRDDVAIDADGSVLPYSAADVRATVLKMVDEGEILAAIIRGPSGDVAVQVFGPPSTEILEILEQTTRGYRAALERRGEPGPTGPPA